MAVNKTGIGDGGKSDGEQQGCRASNYIQGDGEGNCDVMTRPTPTTMFDVRSGGGQ